jgi:hypothetical protein
MGTSSWLYVFGARFTRWPMMCYKRAALRGRLLWKRGGARPGFTLFSQVWGGHDTPGFRSAAGKRSVGRRILGVIMKIDGRCHCGDVTFEAEADPETTTICNCTDCQTMSGAPLRAVIITQPGTFVLLSGKPTEYRKIADSGAVRVQGFCPRCGTAIYATSDGNDPKTYNVRLGAVRQRDELVPRKQLFVRSQQAWVNNLSSIQKFDKMPSPPT